MPRRSAGIRNWTRGVFVGTALGALILGVGGRIGMRIVAAAQGQAASFSIEGTLTVILLGAGAGAIASLIFLLSRTLFPHHRFARAAFFWIPVGALVLRGLNPVTTLNAFLFAPLFLLHGSLLTFYWCWVEPRFTAGTSKPRGRMVDPIETI